MCDLKNTEIEDIFLATIFNKPEWLEDVLLDNKLTDSVFSCPVNRSVYKVIQDLAAKGRAVDLTILYHELDVDEDDDSYEFLDELEPLDTLKKASQYAHELVELFNKRSLLRTLERAKSKIQDNSAMPSVELNMEVQAELSNGFNSIELTADDDVELDCVVDNVLDKIKCNAMIADDFTGARTGLDDLDLVTKGYQPANYIVLGGRPGMGKTTLAMLACLAEARAGGNVRIYSLEMPKEQLVMRLLANMTGISLSIVKSGKFTKAQASKLAAAAGELKSLKDNLVIIDKGQSVITIRSDVLKASRKKPVTLVMVDYFQLLNQRGLEYVRGEETAVLSESSRLLNNLKKEANTAILLLSQLNRSLESRADKRPVNSDLRSTGQLEQDADLIMMAYRDEIYNEASPLKGVYEIGITKFRDGEITVVYGGFEGAVNNIRSLSDDEKSRIKTIINSSAKANISSVKLKKVADVVEDSEPSPKGEAVSQKRISVKNENDKPASENLDAALSEV